MDLGINHDDETVKVLIIDDSPIERDLLVEVVHLSYPKAEIHAPIHLFNQGVEDVISKGQYNLILLDSSLSKHWGSDERFGEWGENMIPFIKEVSKGSRIIAIASNEDDNKTMVARGAHSYINKRMFLVERFKDDSSMSCLV